MDLVGKVVDAVRGEKTTFRLEYSDHYRQRSDTSPVWIAVDVNRLGVSDLLLRFEKGEIGTRSMVEDLFSAFFNRDFSGSGKHWSHDGQSVNQTAVPPDAGMDPDAEAFECKESSTWDWKDIYAVAESQGTCIVDKANKLIRMKNYKFYCSG